jgi:hypothetical protein
VTVRAGMSLLIALVVLTLAAMALLALVGAVFAAPYLLVRFVRGRRQARTAMGPSRRPPYVEIGVRTRPFCPR